MIITLSASFIISMLLLFGVGTIIGINIALLSKIKNLSLDIGSQKHLLHDSFVHHKNEVDNKIEATKKELVSLSSSTNPAISQYTLAKKLIKQGASMQEIIEQCQISRNEIEMLSAVS